MRGRYALEVSSGTRPVKVSLNGIRLVSLPEGGSVSVGIEEWLLPKHNTLQLSLQESPGETGRFALRLKPAGPLDDVPVGLVWSCQPKQVAGPLELTLPFSTPKPPLTRLAEVATALGDAILTPEHKADALWTAMHLYAAFQARSLDAALEAWDFRSGEHALAYPDDPPGQDLLELQQFFYCEPYALEPIVPAQLEWKVRWDDRLVELRRKGGAPFLQTKKHEFHPRQAVRVFLALVEGRWVVAR